MSWSESESIWDHLSPSYFEPKKFNPEAFSKIYAAVTERRPSTFLMLRGTDPKDSECALEIFDLMVSEDDFV